ncbi:hypothetical protein, partial [Shewanella fodinae]
GFDLVSLSLDQLLVTHGNDSCFLAITEYHQQAVDLFSPFNHEWCTYYLNSGFDKQEYKDNAYIQERIYSALELLGAYYFYEKRFDMSFDFLDMACSKVLMELRQDKDNVMWSKDYMRLMAYRLYLSVLSDKVNDEVKFDELEKMVDDNQDFINFKYDLKITKILFYTKRKDFSSARAELDFLNKIFKNKSLDLSDEINSILYFKYMLYSVDVDFKYGNKEEAYNKCLLFNKGISDVMNVNKDMKYVFLKEQMKSCRYYK